MDSQTLTNHGKAVPVPENSLRDLRRNLFARILDYLARVTGLNAPRFEDAGELTPRVKPGETALR